MADTKAAAMNFLKALERIPKLVEQYREKNVEYERDIPILQQIVGGVWKKEEELKQLKSEVAALERKIQLELAPPKSETVQKQTDSGTVQTQSPPTGKRITTEQPSDVPNRSQFLREHVQIVRPIETNNTVKGIKM